MAITVDTVMGMLRGKGGPGKDWKFAVRFIAGARTMHKKTVLDALIKAGMQDELVRILCDVSNWPVSWYQWGGHGYTVSMRVRIETRHVLTRASFL